MKVINSSGPKLFDMSCLSDPDRNRDPIFAVIFVQNGSDVYDTLYEKSMIMLY